MAANHPGYDIESLDEAGNLLRYIEVKATPEEWGELGVSMTKRQFGEAYSRREGKYWLYVVEHAERDDFQIHQIHDPARRVEQFFFDSGWQEVAERESARPTLEAEETKE